MGADTWGQETAWGKRNACHFSVARLEMQDKEGQEVELERWAAAKPCRPRVSWEVWVCGEQGWLEAVTISCKDVAIIQIGMVS